MIKAIANFILFQVAWLAAILSGTIGRESANRYPHHRYRAMTYGFEI